MRSRAALLFPLLLFACALTPVRRPWKVELITSGGFTGKGSGAITMSSDGRIETRSPGGSLCPRAGTAAEIERIEKLLASARPDTWRASYAPENRCCDRIHYRLTITSGEPRNEKKYTTEWISAPLPMPKDLDALSAALLQMLHERACVPTS